MKSINILLLTYFSHLSCSLSRCLQTRDSRRRRKSIDDSLRLSLGHSRSRSFGCRRFCSSRRRRSRSFGCRRRIAGILVLVWPVAEPVTNVGTEITCTQTNTKRRKKPCKPVLSCSRKEARQCIGTETSSSTEQDVLEYLRINSRLLIQAHHLEICLFVHVCLT